MRAASSAFARAIRSALRALWRILKADTISFGQALVPEVIDRRMQAAASGSAHFSRTSLQSIRSRAGTRAKNAGARVVIVNAEATPFDGIADAVASWRVGERCHAWWNGGAHLTPARFGRPMRTRTG